MYILRGISKHGLANFSLLILEYTDTKNLISCEQKWIDFLKPAYNLNPTAGNSKGYKHTPESLEKMNNRIISSETKTKMSLSAKERLKREGIAGPFVGKCHTESSLALLSNAAKNRLTLPVPGLQVEVTNIETNITIRYDSIRKAADALDSDIKTLLRREKNKVIKPYRGIYKINIMRG